jgi:hypothetical protein
LEISKIIKNYQLDNFLLPCFLLLQEYYNKRIYSDIIRQLNPKPKILKDIKTIIAKLNIFEDEDRITSGIKRFKILFLLSPNPMYKKILVFLNREVIYSVLWVLYFKLKLKFGNNFGSQ